MSEDGPSRRDVLRWGCLSPVVAVLPASRGLQAPHHADITDEDRLLITEGASPFDGDEWEAWAPQDSAGPLGYQG